MAIETAEFTVSSTDGWTLSLRRHHFEGRVDPARRPVVLVPGYAMNSFILGFHPGGQSLVEYPLQLAWTSDGRPSGQRGRRAGWRRGRLTRQLALDLPRRSRACARKPVIRRWMCGLPLGASMVYAYGPPSARPWGGSRHRDGRPLRWAPPAAGRVFCRVLPDCCR